MQSTASMTLAELSAELLYRLHAEDYNQSAMDAMHEEFVYDEDLIKAIKLAEELRKTIAKYDYWL